MNHEILPETLQRLIAKAEALNMDLDRYINYMLDTKLTSQDASGVVRTIPVVQLPFTNGSTFTAKVLKFNNKIFKFQVDNAKFQVNTPKALQGLELEFGEEVELLYTEYTSKDKLYGKIQLHQP